MDCDSAAAEQDIEQVPSPIQHILNNCFLMVRVKRLLAQLHKVGSAK